MYNQPYFIPGYYGSIAPNVIRGTSNAITRGAGAKAGSLLSKLGSGISSLRSLNWSGLINNTSKTLNVVNQAIPLVRQVGPMYNNVKSMFKVASVFKDETDKPKRGNNYHHINNSNQNQNNYFQNSPTNYSSKYKSQDDKKNTQINETSNNYDNNSPVFFIP